MVERIFFQVSVTKREAEIKLDNTNFYEKQKNYRSIMWLREGKDPEKMEAKYKKEKLDKEKERRKMRRKNMPKDKNNKMELIKNDTRFQNIEIKKKFKKKIIKTQKSSE